MIINDSKYWKMQVLPERMCKINDLLSQLHPDKNILLENGISKGWIDGYSAENGCKIGAYNIDEMKDITKTNGGGTFKALENNRVSELTKTYMMKTYYQNYDMTVPIKGYCVAMHPELGTWIPADATEEEIACYIETFITRNADLLQSDSRLYFGTWISDDPETEGMISLDISAIIPDKEVAMKLGKMFDQQAIFDLTTFESISCGGAGMFWSNGIALESDVAENYVTICSEYLFDMRESVTMEDILVDKFLKEHKAPSYYGFEFKDIAGIIPKAHNDGKIAYDRLDYQEKGDVSKYREVIPVTQSANRIAYQKE